MNTKKRKIQRRKTKRRMFVGIESLERRVMLHADGLAISPLTAEGEGATSLAGFVYVDGNNNGVKDAGEQPVGGVTVTLTGTNSQGTAVNIPQTTRADGSFRFDGLMAGQYTIAETQPRFLTDGLETVGSQGGTSSTNDQIALSLTDGTMGTGNNFGERRLAPYVLLSDYIVPRSELSNFAQRFDESVLAAVNGTTQLWYSFGPGWTGFTSANIRLSADNSNVLLTVTNADSTQSSATVPLSDTSRVSVVGTDGTAQLLRLHGSPEDFGFTPTTSTVTAQSDTFTVAEDSSSNQLTVLANDSDSAGSTLTVSAFTPPASPNGTIAIATGGTALTYTPNANFFGTETFTYTARNSSGATATATVTVTVTAVNDAPTATNDTATTVEDTSLTIAMTTLTANDSPGPSNESSQTLTVVSVGSPTQGGSVQLSGANVIYTPAANFNGTATFTYVVRDNGQTNGVDDFKTATGTVTVTVTAVNDAPVANNDSGSTNENAALTVSAPGVLSNDTDVDGDTLSVTSSDTASVQGATVAVNANGGYTYDPRNASALRALAPGASTTDSFTYTISDGNGGTATATVTITVTGVNTAPVALNDEGFQVRENESLTVAVPGVLENDTDVDGDNLTAVVASQPANGQVTLNGNGSFVYTPAANFAGTDSFTYRANDGGLDSNVATVTITVIANNAPIANNDSFSTDEDTPLNISAPGLLTNDTDADNDSLVIEGAGDVGFLSQLGAMVFLGAEGSFTYNPRTSATLNALNVGDEVEDTFTYSINDGHGDTATGTVTVTVTGVNDAPTANDDNAVTNQDTPITFDILSNDTDVDGTIDRTSVSLISIPTNGFVDVDAVTGDVTFTPDSGFTGTVSFIYFVQDNNGAGSNQATVTIRVNAPPVANDDSVTANEDVSVVIIDVLANDTDADGTLNPASVTIVDSPTNGNVSVDPQSGEVTYTPGSGFIGVDTFTYTVEDNDGLVSNVATVTVTINGLPIAVDDNDSTDEDTVLTVGLPGVLANDSDPDLDSLSVVAFDSTSQFGATVNVDTSGGFTYDPTNAAALQALNVSSQPIEDTFTYTVSDGRGGSAVATVTITVTGINDAPVANDDSVVSNQDPIVVVDILDNDVDVDGTIDATSVVITDGPTNGNIVVDPVTGVVTYTPNIGFIGTDTFKYTVDDNDGVTSNEATVTIRINDFPIANDDSVFTNENIPAVIDVIANDVDSDGTIDPTSVTITGNPTNGNVTVDPVTGEITYTPDTDFVGVDMFTYTVRDNDGGLSNEATVTITVNTVPIAVDDTGTTDEDTVLSVAAPGVLDNDSDGDSDPLTVTDFDATSQQGATVVVDTDGAFTYDPTTAPALQSLTTGGQVVDTFTYTINDGRGGTATATVSITVTGINDAPIANDDNVVSNQDPTVVIDILANDTDAEDGIDPATVNITVNPANGTLSVDPVTGVVTYTPDSGFIGTDSFTYTVDDDEGVTSNVATVTIRINDFPVATDDPAMTNENTPIIIDVLANDSDSDGTIDPTTVAITSSPNDGSVMVDPITGEITYTPDLDFFGTDSFTYTVRDNDGGLSNTATVTVTVNAIPIAVNDEGTTDEDTVLTGVAPGVLDDDSDPNGDSLEVSNFDAVSQLGADIVVNADGSYSYDPTVSATLQALAEGQEAFDTFTYTISDGRGGFATGTVTITVTGVNDPPVAVDDVATTDEDTVLNVAAPGVLDNDTDDDLVTVTAFDATSVLGATVSVSGDGGYSYDPTNTTALQALAVGQQIEDTFTYTITDGHGETATATVTVTVTGINDAPIANDDDAVTNPDVPVLIDVPANDTDVDGTIDATTVTVVSPAANGTTDVDPVTGVITYTPDSGFIGFDSFTYTVRDNDGVESNSATVTIRVNDPPFADDDTALTNVDVAVVVDVLSNDTDTDGTVDPSTVVVTIGPSNGMVSVDPVTGAITYTPDAAFFGTDTFNYTVNDNDGATSNEAIVTIDVNRPPVAVDDMDSTDEDMALNVAVPGVLTNDTDDDGDSIIVTAFDATSQNGAVVSVGADGDFSYDPTGSTTIQALAAGQQLEDTFTYTIDDGRGGTATGTVTVTVTGINDAPIASDDSDSTDVNSDVVIDVAANDSDVDGTLDLTTVAIVSGPTNGMVAVDPVTGAITYTPDLDFIGSDSFTYTIDDNDGATSNEATVNVNVGMMAPEGEGPLEFERFGLLAEILDDLNASELSDNQDLTSNADDFAAAADALFAGDSW